MLRRHPSNEKFQTTRQRNKIVKENFVQIRNPYVEDGQTQIANGQRTIAWCCCTLCLEAWEADNDGAYASLCP